MCLAVPGEVIEIYEEEGLRMGRVDYSGMVSRTCLEYVPEAKVGQYVIVHAGFAISLLDEEDAKKSFEAWEEFSDSVEEASEAER